MFSDHHHLTGNQHAMIGQSFYRQRHAKRPRYKRTKRQQPDQIRQFKKNVRIARQHFALARAKHWAGSFAAAAADVLSSTKVAADPEIIARRPRVENDGGRILKSRFYRIPK